MNAREAKVIRLQDAAGGVAAGIRSVLASGRREVVTAGPNAQEFGFIGSDPYNTNVGTGLIVPATPSSAISDARYLFVLARASFNTGEQSSDLCGVRLVGIRQYAELIARIPAGSAPLGSDGPATTVFRKEITSPLWHPPDGDISWHVMVVHNRRDKRNPSNTDGFIYQDAQSPALIYQAGAPNGIGYVPPNAGRPWGAPIAGSLGNMHDLRYRWRDDKAEWPLDIPIPVPCDVVLFASVRQNDPAINPTLDFNSNLAAAALVALSPEDQFITTFSQYAQYGAIAGSLVFDYNIGRNVP